MHVVRDPDMDTTLAFLKEELARQRDRRGHLVQVLAACRVDYAGRATSTLDQGERLILVKSDGTLLVHTAQKAKPVNWMPAGGTTFAVARHEDGVELTATRRKPHNEVVKITLTDTRLLLALPLRDSQELVLRRTEGDLHRLFYEHPELLEDGLVMHRGEMDGRRGPIDLWGTDHTGRRVVVEVKRSKAGIQEATQLWRYMEPLRNGDTVTGPANEPPQAAGEASGATDAGAWGNGSRAAGPVRGILIAPGISAKARALLQDHGLEYHELDWDDLLSDLERPRAAGQSTLGRFGASTTKSGRTKTKRVPDASASDGLVPEATVRTGKRRR